MIIPNSRERLDVLLPDWTLTQQLYDITVELMDGVSFSPCLAKDAKGDRHLDAPYY
jgi:hypothetical protein